LKFRKNNNEWSQVHGDEPGDVIPGYSDKCLIALNGLDNVFHAARSRCEYEFIWCLLSLKKMQDSGWDPFDTISSAITEILSVSNSISNQTAQKNLQLWLYVHIMEASEIYEKIINMVNISNGGIYCTDNFPLKKGNRPWSPGEKIRAVLAAGKSAGLDKQVSFLSDIWNRNLRNAISHSEYVIYSTELRLLNPQITFSREEVADKVNFAIAFFQSFKTIINWHIASYKTSRIIHSTAKYSSDGLIIEPGIPAEVLIRDGHGIIGLKSAWSKKEKERGAIEWLAAKLNDSEKKAMNESIDSRS